MELPSWATALIGAVVGGLISFGAQYQIFRYNRKKEERRNQIAVVARISGSMDNLANAVFRAMESSVWLGYAVVARNFGIATDLDIPTLLKIERECLLEYDRIRGEIEIGLSEYWGHIGNDDDEFTNFIIRYRKCTLPSDYSALKFQSKEEVNEFNVPMHVSKIREQLEADPTSHFAVCKDIVKHLRHFIAPIK